MKLKRRRKFTNRKKEIIYFSLFFLLLFITVGYAYLSRTLSITGQTELAANTWDIHFENLSVKEGSVTASTPAAIQSNTTSINYSVLLNKPGDFYEFEVDIVNAGTLGGKVSLVNIQGISSAAEPYLEHSIKYTKGNPVQVDDLLNPGARKRIVVRVGYKEDLNSLPDSNIVLDLELDIPYSQTNDEESPFNPVIQELIDENPSCMTKYEGQVTDQVGQTVTAKNVYFDKCINKRNIIFNNMCWQMIRTTETGGIKMIYNGEVVDGKCLSTRETHKGIVGANGSTQTLNSNYLYGDSFTYDVINNTFTLTDTTTATWSDSTYQNLLGKFTCKNTTGTCTTLYNVNGYKDNTTAKTSAYTIGDTNYAGIGTSSFNANYRGPAMVGYMFNKAYNEAGSTAPTSGSLMGNDVSYSNGTYTLLPASGESELGTTKDATHHYTCNSTSSTCSKVRYYYNNNYYIELDGEANIEEAINNMLYNDNVNRYNSSIKGIIDSWYAQNLSTKTNMLEDTIYCNDRSISDYGGWNPNGGSIYAFLKFKNYNFSNDLSCTNVTDQFALSNNKAKLTYPVGLATQEELYILTNNNSTYYRNLTNIGATWWLLTPSNLDESYSVLRYVNSTGEVGGLNWVDLNSVVRLVVSLESGAMISSGTGSESDPWIVE